MLYSGYLSSLKKKFNFNNNWETCLVSLIKTAIVTTLIKQIIKDMLIFCSHISLVVAAAEAMKTRLSTAVVSRSTLLNITIYTSQCFKLKTGTNIARYRNNTP